MIFDALGGRFRKICSWFKLPLATAQSIELEQDFYVLWSG